MKKTILLAGILSVGYASAQKQGRVGINTTEPRASLEIKRHEGLPTTNVQGFLLPRMSQDQRNDMDQDKLISGLQIFNTSKNCIDWWNGEYWQCTDGGLKDNHKEDFIAEVEFHNSAYWYSSIADNDYLSITGDKTTLEKPVGPASLEARAADGKASGGYDEPALNVQGKITTLDRGGLQRAIPIKVIKGGSLEGLTTYATIPAQYTKDGAEATVVLSWEKAKVHDKSTYLMLNIYAKDKDIELKQLDLVAGQGEDQMGILMAAIKIPKDSKERLKDSSTWTGTYELRLISGIPDQMFTTPVATTQDGTKQQQVHRYLYVPTMGPDGKIWLNNNLGAYYADTRNAVFNPGKQAEAVNDHHAYGSLAKWGKKFDGAELVSWDSRTVGKPTYPFKEWADNTSKAFYDNCPEGWHTPTKDELDKVSAANRFGINRPSTMVGNMANLHITNAGYRVSFDPTIFNDVGLVSHLWSSSLDTATGTDLAHTFYNGGATSGMLYGNGAGIRCIKGKSNNPPAPQPPATKTYTATAVWGDDANEQVKMSKQNCPNELPYSGDGVEETYPRELITYAASSEISQEDQIIRL